MTIDPELAGDFTGILSASPKKNKDGTFNYRGMCKPLRKLRAEADYIEYFFACLNAGLLKEWGPEEGVPGSTGLFLFKRNAPWDWVFFWEKDRNVRVSISYSSRPSLRVFNQDLSTVISLQRNFFGRMGILLDQKHWEMNKNSEYDPRNAD